MEKAGRGRIGQANAQGDLPAAYPFMLANFRRHRPSDLREVEAATRVRIASLAAKSSGERPFQTEDCRASSL